MNQSDLDLYRIAAVLRMARAAAGLSQVELAQRLGMSKTTLARAETADGGLRVEQLARVLRLHRELGVSVDFLSGDEVRVTLDKAGLEMWMQRLNDEAVCRIDQG